jgi:hypothetical protein
MNLFLKSKEAEVDKPGQGGLLISRLVIGVLWATQLSWKMPTTFGCLPGFTVSTSISFL